MNIERAREILWKEYDNIPDEKIEEMLIQMTSLCSKLLDYQMNTGKDDPLESSLEKN